MFLFLAKLSPGLRRLDLSETNITITTDPNSSSLNSSYMSAAAVCFSRLTSLQLRYSWYLSEEGLRALLSRTTGNALTVLDLRY